MTASCCSLIEAGNCSAQFSIICRSSTWNLGLLQSQLKFDMSLQLLSHGVPVLGVPDDKIAWIVIVILVSA